MKILHAKIRSGYQKEAFLAFFLIFIIFLPFGHVYFENEYLSTYQLWGLTYNCEWATAQYFVWELLSRLVFILYCFLLFHKSTHRFKGFIPFFLFLTLFNLSYFLLIPIENFSGPFIFESVSLLLASFLFFSIPFFRNTLKARLILNGISFANLLAAIVISTLLVVKYIIDGRGIQNLDLFLFTIHSYGFHDLNAFLWVFGAKASLLLLLSYWFLVETKWWKYALLSPILLTVYQLRSVLTTEEHFFDESEFISALPLFTMVVFLLICLSKNAKNQFIYEAIRTNASKQVEKRVLEKRQEKMKSLSETKSLLNNFNSDFSKATERELKELKGKLQNHLDNI